jgi:hypothetical protein
MSKRVTKAQLLEQLEAANGEKWDLQQRLHTTNEVLAQTKIDLGRYRKLASVSVDKLQPEDQIAITMHVDRRHYHDGGRNLMRNAVLSMLSKLDRELAADVLPDKVDQVFEREDIKNFLAEWLYVTVFFPIRMALPTAMPPKAFWIEVLIRLFATVDALKKAGLNNYKVRQELMSEAYNNPIKI